MLFILNKTLIPSPAEIVQVVPRPEKIAQHRQFIASMLADISMPPIAVELRQTVRQENQGTRIELGLTPICPYGLSACWGGAYDALSSLTGVERMVPFRMRVAPPPQYFSQIAVYPISMSGLKSSKALSTRFTVFAVS